MSHFTVLVIGDDVDGQLAPYDEEIQVAPYRRYISDPDWLFKFYAEKHPDTEQPSLEVLAAFLNEQWVDEDDEREYGVDEIGLYQWSTYNPKSKWDWWVIGGRWRGYFKLKEGVRGAAVGRPGTFDNDPTFDADVVQAGDVDAEWMRNAAGEAAGKRWDTAQGILDAHPKGKTWPEVREAHGEDIDRARVVYREQPVVRAFNLHDGEARDEERWDDVLIGWSGHFDQYEASREEYVENARRAALPTYAYVKNGEWFAPGEMLMFGVSTDEKEDMTRYQDAFNVMFDELDPETILTLVDCHI